MKEIRSCFSNKAELRFSEFEQLLAIFPTVLCHPRFYREPVSPSSRRTMPDRCLRARGRFKTVISARQIDTVYLDNSQQENTIETIFTRLSYRCIPPSFHKLFKKSLIEGLVHFPKTDGNRISFISLSRYLVLSRCAYVYSFHDPVHYDDRHVYTLRKIPIKRIRRSTACSCLDARSRSLDSPFGNHVLSSRWQENVNARYLLGRTGTLTYEFWLDHDVLQIKLDRFGAVRFLTYNNSGSAPLLGIVTSRTTK